MEILEVWIQFFNIFFLIIAKKNSLCRDSLVF